MQPIRGDNPYKELDSILTTNCEACSGLCCFALFFSRQDGFPADKAPETPCGFLAGDYRCSCHEELPRRGFRGCLSFDCLGAGQLVTQGVYRGLTWKTNPDKASEICGVFWTVRLLHQMLWYLTEAASLAAAGPSLASELGSLISETLAMTRLGPTEILSLNVESHQDRVNAVLKQAIDLVQRSSGAAARRAPADCIGKDLRKKKPAGMDFSMSLLIAADLRGQTLCSSVFLGADLRDARLEDADLSDSLFLTQAQINSAGGNAETKLPPRIVRPDTWQTPPSTP